MMLLLEITLIQSSEFDILLPDKKQGVLTMYTDAPEIVLSSDDVIFAADRDWAVIVFLIKDIVFRNSRKF